MEGIPEITGAVRSHLKIRVRSYMMDHRSLAGVILPAVEIMEILADSVLSACPGVDVLSISDARFDRFIPLEQGRDELECFADIEYMADGCVRVKLLTRAALKGGITRTKEHASMVFGRPFQGDSYPADMACCVEGVAFEVQAADLYRELVPFGPSYRNLAGVLYLTKEGALGAVSGGNIHGESWPLGSPFPLDAAFHAACAWGQRYAGFVPFPVGFAARKIFAQTRPDESLICRIAPLPPDGDSLCFDIRIYRHDGTMCESVRGLVMKDVSGGAAVPPEWVRRGAENRYFSSIENRCRTFAVVERKAVAPFALQALSPAESERNSGMGQRRSDGFIAARLCCKRMSRLLSGNDLDTAPGGISTIDAEGIRPVCPLTDGSGFVPCSVSHDSRFAFAASGNGKTGVDVEKLADRVIKGKRFYMNEAEAALSETSALGDIAASLRIWSIKECVSKALDLKLYEAWRLSEVVRVGGSESAVVVDGREYAAWHDQVDDHLFTLLMMD